MNKLRIRVPSAPRRRAYDYAVKGKGDSYLCIFLYKFADEAAAWRAARAFAEHDVTPDEYRA